MAELTLPISSKKNQKAIKPAFTYADLIVDYLCQVEVEYVFGIPGGAIEGFFDALSRRSKGQVPNVKAKYQRALERRESRQSDGPRLVVARHESGAAFMADGYARETGRLGVCCSTTGPGATNLITGVANAYVDKVPMLVVTPQTALPSHGNRAFQESSSDLVDVVSMFEQCTRYSSMISHPDQLEGKLCTALATAFRRPRGPVHLSIPADILSLPVRSASARFNVATLLREPIAVDDSSYHALHHLVESARIKGRDIVIFVGEDCAEACDIIENFAERISARIVSSPAAKRWVNGRHPLYRGVFGFAGHPSARETLLDPNVDLVLAVGTSFGELDTAGWDTAALLNDRLVHISSSVTNFERSPMAYLHVYGNLKALFTRLSEGMDANNYAYRSSQASTLERPLEQAVEKLVPPTIAVFDEEKCLSLELPIKPQRLMSEIVAKFPEDSTYLIDTGNAWSWATHYMHLAKMRALHISMGFGAMGWAIGAVVGSGLGRRGTSVCITGDGAYLMSAQEISVAVELNLAIVYIILNDRALGMVKHGQILNKAEEVGVELPSVDFAAIARAQGANGVTVETWEQWEQIDLVELLGQDKPLLIDVIIDGEEVPPMKSRLDVLQTAKHNG